MDPSYIPLICFVQHIFLWHNTWYVSILQYQKLALNSGAVLPDTQSGFPERSLSPCENTPGSFSLCGVLLYLKP